VIWLRNRAVVLAGILCLLGQGILLFAVKSGVEMPMLPVPWLFVLLSLGFITVLAFWQRAHPKEKSPRQVFWRLITVVSAMALLGLAFLLLLIGEKAPKRVDDESSSLAEAAVEIANLEPALVAWWTRAEVEMRGAWPVSALQWPVAGGDLFRALTPLPEMWPSDPAGPKLGVVIWAALERNAVGQCHGYRNDTQIM